MMLASHIRSTQRALLAFALLMVHAGANAQSSQPLPGGPSRLYRWPEAQRNLLDNHSFEQTHLGAPKLWNLGSSPHWRLSTVHRSGARSLLVRNSHLATFTPLASQKVILRAGWYNLRGHLKTQGAGRGDGSGGRINLWKGKSGDATRVVSGTRNWTAVGRRSILLDQGPAWVRLEAYRKPDGNVFFDDISLRRLVPPFVEGFLLYPNYRGLLFKDRPQKIRVSVTARPEALGRSPDDFLVRLVLETSTGKAIRSLNRSVRPHTSTTLSLDASQAPLGRLRLRILALDSVTRVPFFEYPSYTIVKLAASARSTLKTYIDADNALVLDGRRRFALGIYDTSGRSSKAEYYEPRIAKIAEAPFNLYLNYWLAGASKNEVAALTTTLRKHGMSYLHTANSWYEGGPHWPAGAVCKGSYAGSLGARAFTICKATELRDVPGVAGWYTADERPAGEAARTFDQYVLLRGNDRDGIAFIAQNRPRELTRWRDAADVFGVDPYPIYNIPEGKLSPFDMVLNWVTDAQGAVERGRPVWAVIQFFKHGPNGHWPTYKELRNMSYMAIIGGAKGLFYWSHGAGALSWVGDPALKERYWKRLVKVTKEIRALEPVLLAPNDSDVVVSTTYPDRMRVMSKTVGGTRYIFAVNHTSRANLSVRFTLAKWGAKAIVRDERRSRPISGRTFTDLFGPYGVHVYQIPAQ